MTRLWMTLAGLLGALSLAVAAWSSHGLASFVPAGELPLALERAHIANQYLLVHTLALLGVALGSRLLPSAWMNVAGALFVLGIAGFAGGLYLVRVIANIQTGPLIYLVPIGGSSLILGWLAIAVAGWRQR